MPSSDANLLSSLLIPTLPEWKQTSTRGCLSLVHPNGDMLMIFTAKRRWGCWQPDEEGWTHWVPQPGVYKGRGWRERMAADILERVENG